jgi:hypothetical protein
MMARKVHVCIKNWKFHLVTPPKCLKLPSSIPKTAHVKFRATSGSLSTTLSCVRKLCHCSHQIPFYCFLASSAAKDIRQNILPGHSRQLSRDCFEQIHHLPQRNVRIQGSQLIFMNWQIRYCNSSFLLVPTGQTRNTGM